MGTCAWSEKYFRYPCPILGYNPGPTKIQIMGCIAGLIKPQDNNFQTKESGPGDWFIGVNSANVTNNDPFAECTSTASFICEIPDVVKSKWYTTYQQTRSSLTNNNTHIITQHESTQYNCLILCIMETTCSAANFLSHDPEHFLSHDLGTCQLMNSKPGTDTHVNDLQWVLLVKNWAIFAL